MGNRARSRCTGICLPFVPGQDVPPHQSGPAVEPGAAGGVALHPEDAAARGIQEGDTVEVFNDRGRLRTVAHLTPDICRGVTALAQGSWYQPDENGTDLNGSINVLTSLRPTPYAHGNAQHTNLVEVAKQGSPG